MTCEKCLISTNLLKGCNLTHHGSKRQIEMFMVRFTLGRNLSLVWHATSVSSQPTIWKVVTWSKDKLKCSWIDSLWGNSFTCMTGEKCFIWTNLLKGCKLTQHGSKRQIKMFMDRFTLGENLSLVWQVKSVSSQPTFWKVATWQNMVLKGKF